MSTVKAIALERALAMLRASGYKYAVQMEDGTIKGELKIAPPTPERIRAASKYPTGFLRGKVEPIIKDMAPGDAAVVPYDGIEPEVMQSTACNAAAKLWGSGNYMSHRNAVGVEILRVS